MPTGQHPPRGGAVCPKTDFNFRALVAHVFVMKGSVSFFLCFDLYYPTVHYTNRSEFLECVPRRRTTTTTRTTRTTTTFKLIDRVARGEKEVPQNWTKNTNIENRRVHWDLRCDVQ